MEPTTDTNILLEAILTQLEFMSNRLEMLFLLMLFNSIIMFYFILRSMKK